MLYVGIFSVFISILLMFYILILNFNAQSIEMSERVEKIGNIDKKYIELKNENAESLISIIYNSIGSILLKFTPKYKLEKYNILLEKAGVLRETSTEKIIARKAILILLLSLIVTVITFYLIEDIIYSLLFAVLIGFLINVFSKFKISRKINKRTNDIIRSLPFTLDLITVSVEAGLSLDGAIGKIVSSIEGPLAHEFGKTLKEMRMGIDKKTALKNMGSRLEIKDLSMLLSSLIQADELGVSLGKILRIEGDQLREKRRQAAREKAMKAPVKMLFPLLLFIFPSIFVIILGPAVITMLSSF